MSFQMININNLLNIRITYLGQIKIQIFLQVPKESTSCLIMNPNSALCTSFGDGIIVSSGLVWPVKNMKKKNAYPVLVSLSLLKFHTSCIAPLSGICWVLFLGFLSINSSTLSSTLKHSRYKLANELYLLIS